MLLVVISYNNNKSTTKAKLVLLLCSLLFSIVGSKKKAVQREASRSSLDILSILLALHAREGRLIVHPFLFLLLKKDPGLPCYSQIDYSYSCESIKTKSKERQKKDSNTMQDHPPILTNPVKGKKSLDRFNFHIPSCHYRVLIK
jgi:hypothetical protein